MHELGLFPLGVVLVPTERMPLHVFEPRYKELIGECLDEDRDFGLLLADEDGLRKVGTRANVVEVLDRFEDGRLNVLVEGRERFRVVELTDGRPYQTAEVEPLADEDEDAAPAEEAERAIALYRSVGELAGADVDELEPDSAQLSFELAARVDFGLELKQSLLEQRSEPERLRLVADLLERAAELMAIERRRSDRASRNGKVTPLDAG